MPRHPLHCRQCNIPFYSRSGRLQHEQKHKENNNSDESYGDHTVVNDDEIQDQTLRIDHSKVQNELLNRYLKHSMVLETQHNISKTSVNEIFSLVHDTLKFISSNFDQETGELILKCMPNVDVLLNEKNRDDEIANRSFDCKPEESSWSGHKVYHLPLKGLLTMLFKKKTIVDLIDSTCDRQSERGIYCDIIDGSVIRNSEFFTKYKDALQFILYLDECF